MSGPADFAKIAVTEAHISAAKATYSGMGDRAEAGEFGWAGFAAEHALADAVAPPLIAQPPIGTLAYDLELIDHRRPDILRVEVKTRVAERGWTHPEKYDWLVIPTHAGREPIKAAAQMVVFCWYSLEEAHQAWVLGYLRGVDEFKRRAVFYREDEPLPRGGWARAGGAYALDVKNLRPLPRRMLKEIP